MNNSNSSQNNTKSICSLCHASFECGKDSPTGCWCDKLPNIVLFPLNSGRCLCPDCLDKKIEEILQKKTKQ